MTILDDLVDFSLQTLSKSQNRDRGSHMRNMLTKAAIVFISICFFLNVFSLVYGMDSENKLSKNDREKRSCIQVVDGYAFLSENMTLAETRETAFVNAKRQALEMTTSFIQSKTTVQNFELVDDRINATSEGSVKIIEQKDFGVENNTRYHVWIKAEVEYGIKSLENIGSSDDYMSNASPLTIKVWTSKEQYKKGEDIHIFLKGNIGFYARVVDISSNGEITQLLPNEFRQNHLFEAGKIYTIPDKKDKFTLIASPPFGVDKIVVYASDLPLGPVSMEKMDNGFGRYNGTKKSLAIKTRGIAVTQIEKGTSSIAQFFEGTSAITIKSR